MTAVSLPSPTRNITAQERQQVLYDWNETQADYPAEVCIHELFEQQAARTPEAIALEFGQASLTYAELNRQANRLAHYLRELGVKPDARVAIRLERGFGMVVALLAVLKAGGAYVPLDPAYPVERLRYMLEDSDPVALLTNASLNHQVGACTLPVVDVEAGRLVWQEQPDTNPDGAVIGLSARHLAYVIYTSGSTGEPKGVMVEHRNVARLFAATNPWFQFSRDDVWTLFHSFSFDFSVWEIWGALLFGGRLIIVPREVARSPQEFYALVCQQGVTILNHTPSAFRQLQGAQLAVLQNHKLRCVIFGGEALEVATLKPWYEDSRNQQTRLINMYGITETTVHVTYRALVESDIETCRRKGSPVGCRIPDLRIYILDERREPVPVGAAGELYVAGAGVARGYLNRPELTAERFVKDPFVADKHARMYKTGDLGRWLPDGNIEFLGRNDFQIKIRGFRIELGEIEARLTEHAGVGEAVVVAREDSLGGKRLVAYYTGTAEPVSVEQMRAHLTAKLPEYMVPAAYVRLERMPLTPNGKLDRRALPAPQAAAYGVREYEAPRGETEVALSRVWAEVLGVDRVGRNDNFLDLGGHSLSAVRVITRLQGSLTLTIGDLLSLRVLADLAGGLKSAVPAALPPITPVDRRQTLPLSFAQQRLWFLAQTEGLSEAYHIAVGGRLTGPLNVVALRRALDRIVERHEALRTSFGVEGGEPVQRIAAAETSRFPLVEHDLRGREETTRELERLWREEAGTRFDLEQGPLIRGRLVRLGEEEHALLITVHHIAFDGWSLGVMMRELSALYGAYSGGEADPLPELRLQYADYAVWRRRCMEGEVLQQQAEYWKRTLAGSPVLLELPTDHVRPAQQDYAGAFAELTLDDRLTARLKELSRRHGTTLFTTLLAGWAALLGRLSGQTDVVIGVPAANRGQQGIEGLIGFFVNTLALRIDMAGSPTASELIGRVTPQMLAAQQNQDIPFEQVVELANPPRSLAHSPLFQVMFAWQDSEGELLDLVGVRTGPLRSAGHGTAKFDLTLSMQEAGGRIEGGVDYATALFEQTTVERYLGYYRMLLEEMVADESQVVDRLPLLSPEERERVLYEWNRTEAEYPAEMCIHELFEAQVEKTPHAIAVVHEGRELSYGELNRQANRLAHYLREMGVKPDARVALLLERSVDLIIAELAVLKCGGAYVPVDRSFPAEFRDFILKDSASEIVLSLESLKLPNLPGVTRIDLDKLDVSTQPDDAVSVQMTHDEIAYVMYTSGSTGYPKGVIVPHKAIRRLVWNAGFMTFEANDRMAFASNPSFDASTLELWAPLVNGAAVVIIDQEMLTDPRRFRRALRHYRISVLWLTVGLFNQYARILAEELSSLRYLIVGGDALDVRIVSRFLLESPPGHFINGYGPTETTTFAATYELAEISEQARSIPIGRPIANTRIYILDGNLQPVPVGVTGELYIGGAGVARGYLNRPELTAERFVKDPFVADKHARMYKTGDLGRWLPDGNIEFLGRNDFQIKIRGFRIELGEIEARLTEHAGVGEAVVVARKDSPGDNRLVAYYTGTAEPVSVEQMRAHLTAKLPEYMVPAAYVRLERMPLTPNGKLDRKALPAPEAAAYGVREYEAPRGETEVALSRVWAEVLGVDRVGRNDNFFHLGGHSLLAVKLTSRIEQKFHVRLPLVAIHQAPTVEQSARLLSSTNLPDALSSRVIKLRDGDGPPLICIAGAGADVLTMRGMASHLSDSRAVCAVQTKGVLGEAAPLGTIKEIAEDCLQQIESRQEKGPYYIAGFSAGALVAFEIGRMLHARGEPIGSLILLDPPTPAARGGAHKWLDLVSHVLQRTCYHAAKLSRINVRFWGAYLREKAGQIRSTDQLASDVLGDRKVVYDATVRATRQYKPIPYDGTGLLITASIRENSFERDYRSMWRRLLLGGTKIRIIETNHLGLLRDPHVRDVAKEMSTYIAESR